jgi:hypothetical protein
MGGLGNQIFQIFATISYSIRSGQTFKFVNVKTLGGGSTTIRNTYWNSFFSKLQPYLFNEYPEFKIVGEKDFAFNDLSIFDMIGQKNILIYGYFQSYKYFQDSYKTICNIIELQSKKDQLMTKMNYNEEYLNNCISMHFRIGDYKKIQEVHPIMTKEYYSRCLNHIKSLESEKKFNVLYFCENSDLDDVKITIDFLSEKFPEYNFIRGENKLEDWEQMLFMSCCHHNIIANSSFSWWSAYFNSHEDKIVCYPSTWFGPATNHDTKDLCPPSWKKIDA